jgi:hypothetical protein
MKSFFKSDIERGATWASPMGLVVSPNPLSFFNKKLHERNFLFFT